MWGTSVVVPPQQSTQTVRLRGDSGLVGQQNFDTGRSQRLPSFYRSSLFLRTLCISPTPLSPLSRHVASHASITESISIRCSNAVNFLQLSSSSSLVHFLFSFTWTRPQCGETRSFNPSPLSPSIPCVPKQLLLRPLIMWSLISLPPSPS